MHGHINVKSPNNISKWQMEFNSAFKWLIFYHVTLLKCYAVAQLVEALRYKPEAGGFDSRWCQWNFY
jgi:hypothetical protein